MPKLTCMPRRRGLLGALAALVMTLASPALAQERPSVVTVNYALSYFAERLGGGEIDVIFPVPEGVDPSFWRPGISDISLMQGADLIILNGAGFATWTTKASLPRSRLIDASRSFEARFIATGTVTHSHGADGEHSHAGTASFTWLDPEQAILQARAIADALAQRGLVSAADIDTRLVALTDDLAELHAAGEGLRPRGEDKVLIATHPRYQYLGRAFGLDIRALEWEAGALPDAEQVAELAALAEETGARILIWEAEPPEGGTAILRDLGLEGVVFPTLATTPEGTDYVARFRRAVDDLGLALAAVDG